jgi:hypothetical protein
MDESRVGLYVAGPWLPVPPMDWYFAWPLPLGRHPRHPKRVIDGTFKRQSYEDDVERVLPLVQTAHGFCALRGMPA